MKRTGRCPKCDATKIGVVKEVRDEDTGPRARHLASEIWQGHFLSETRPVGQVEAYVCTECGYFEEYLARPEAMEWEKVRGFSWRAKGEPGPFR